MQSRLKLRGLLVMTLLPALLLYSFFVIIPIFRSSYYGFFEWSGMGDATFIGFQNYIEVVQSPIFWRAFKNNLIIVGASVLGQVPIALGLALLLRKSNMFQRFVRSAVFLPMVISTVVVGLIWGYIFDLELGVINTVLRNIGLESWTRAWLADPDVNMYAVSIPIIWNYIGPYLIIFIATIQNIPGEIEEAALLDGAIGWKKLIYIILPNMWGTIKVVIILCISGSLKAFDQVFVMTGGGPAQSTEILATYMYNNTFLVYRYGFGSAISTMIIILSLILIAISQILMKRKD
ncbi:sugar ABC transporter permease [Halolactibacillus alkaliphilus]|uniref:Sugar ABC transporter permease n=1 Tax=Halolactibacillus alkaliphilus TaxID=442899 RepID=A0A511X0D8_9BACI|nr:sugar ABC transporter permease [Halolactibacillus alkaliphilus]GEN56380.1 sugar ABC transporter permease [Halolactibacillus alkaliphilus]GGN67423.1 sugar ABC transporter permease [Halolactibacillus alkaliphilus]SFO92127.1 raffinose/stachyose/melibiose transport system permease protein [Halolactibacillus alkaliphilus]